MKDYFDKNFGKELFFEKTMNLKIIIEFLLDTQKY